MFVEEDKRVTGPDVYTEVQPGNNNTRVNLFQLRCDDEECLLFIHVVASNAAVMITTMLPNIGMLEYGNQGGK